MYDELVKRLRDFAVELRKAEDALLVRDAAEAIEELSKERKKGKWIHFSRSDECSVCGYDTGKYEAPTWFCPKCGADMRGEA